jgi:hypothetical protein
VRIFASTHVGDNCSLDREVTGVRARGITYDTGFITAGGCSRPQYDPEVVRRELTIIRDDLHCNAVRISGGDPERLALAAGIAAELGLEIWFSPYPLDLTTGELLALFAECARRAEALRRAGADVVLVTGAELSLMNPGFLPGDDLAARVDGLVSDREHLGERVAALATAVNRFLADAVAVVREHFGGRVTYAAVPLEQVDWEPFDLVSLDLYRTAEVADRYQEGLRALVAGGKPVAITEFGSMAWRGANDDPARGMEIAELDERGAPVRLKGDYERDEEGQAAYLRELLEIFATEGVDSAFVFLFALDGWFHRPDGDPRHDLDRASPAIVRVLDGVHGDTYPDMTWEPKAAFHALADVYGRDR